MSLLDTIDLNQLINNIAILILSMLFLIKGLKNIPKKHCTEEREKRKSQWKEWPATLAPATTGGARKPPGPKLHRLTFNRLIAFFLSPFSSSFVNSFSTWIDQLPIWLRNWKSPSQSVFLFLLSFSVLNPRTLFPATRLHSCSKDSCQTFSWSSGSRACWTSDSLGWWSDSNKTQKMPALTLFHFFVSLKFIFLSSELTEAIIYKKR